MNVFIPNVPDGSTLRFVEYDFYNGIAAAGCIPGYS